MADHIPTALQYLPNFGGLVADDYVGTAEAARLLGGISQDRVRQLIKEGRLPAIKLGRDYAILRSDLEKVKERPTGRPPKPKS